MLTLPLALLHLIVPAQLIAAAPRTPLPAPRPGVVPVVVHQNKTPAGQLRGNTLTLALDVVESGWHPEGDADTELRVLAFAEAGKAPRLPGPLLRAPRGTAVVLTLRNRTDSALVIGGLAPGAAKGADTVQLKAGATRIVRFTLGAAGTFAYWGAFAGTTPGDRYWLDSQLNGAIVVDAPGASTRDEILLLSEWFLDHRDDRSWEIASVINGKGWPHTDVLRATQGDSMRVRVINMIPLAHPLHLHGFYYRIESQGDTRTDTPIPIARRPLSNTDLIEPLHTATFSFVASTPGNWLFHCHLAFHVDETVSVAGAPRAAADATNAGTPHTHEAPDAVTMSRRASAMGSHLDAHMRGLVVGLVVASKPGYREPSTANARRLDLFVQQKPRALRAGAPAIGFALQQGDTPPARDSVVLPGPVLELRRGQPVAITVHNHLAEPTSVHWHGLEIESYPDGVPHWSGLGTARYGQVDPGGTFTAAFVPPRAGTFPYHSHFNDRKQITSGMYGALIVTDTPRDTTRDHIIVVGGGGPWVEPKEPSPFALVNGLANPRPLQLQAGVTHRLRLVTLHPDWIVRLTLVSDRATMRWTPIAKDGADLPPLLRTAQLAQITMGPGQTADMAFTPLRPGSYTLEVRTDDGGGWSIRVPVRVEAAKR
jgi:manganese oxidase